MTVRSGGTWGWLIRLWQAGRKPLWVGLVVSVALIAVFVALAEDIMEGQTLAWDTWVIASVRGATSPALTGLMLLMTMLGDAWVLTILGVTISAAWWRAGRRVWVASLLTSALGAAGLDALLKILIQRARPDITTRLIRAGGYSFPSGHAMISLCFYGLILYLMVTNQSAKVRLAALLGGLLLVGAIGLSRIYLGVHYPSDVLGGFAAGSVWLLANMLAYTQYRRRRRGVTLRVSV